MSYAVLSLLAGFVGLGATIVGGVTFAALGGRSIVVDGMPLGEGFAYVMLFVPPINAAVSTILMVCLFRFLRLKRSLSVFVALSFGYAIGTEIAWVLYATPSVPYHDLTGLLIYWAGPIGALVSAAIIRPKQRV
jgi:hypothetical protein